MQPLFPYFIILLANMILVFGCGGGSNNIVTMPGNNQQPDISSIASNFQKQKISTDGGATCAVLSDGKIKCWGYNNWGALGNGTSKGPDTCGMYYCGKSPIEVTSISNAVSVSLDGTHTCALITDGTIKCWGTGVLGNGELGNSETCGISGASCSTVPVTVSDITNASAISVGFDACTLLSEGQIKCWGWNTFGGLGNGTNTKSLTPTTVLNINNAINISSGQLFACALLSNGTIKCWGYNYAGELGDGTLSNSSTPVSVSGINNAVDVCSDGFHSCAVLLDKTIRCWGDNRFGKLGDGTTIDSKNPVEVVGINNAVDVDCGLMHTCVLLSDRSVKCWGENSLGQLGNGMTTGPDLCELGEYKYACSKTPVSVLGLTNVINISAGGANSCALLNDGSIKCWGINDTAQLGIGTNTGPETSCGYYKNESCSAIPVTALFK